MPSPRREAKTHSSADLPSDRGFAFALAPGYNYILAGLVLAVVPVMLFLLIWKTCFRRLLRKLSSNDEQQQQQQEEEAPPSYDAHPWREGAPQGGSDGGGGLGISLSALRKDGSRKNGRRRDRGPDLGAVQTPREVV